MSLLSPADGDTGKTTIIFDWSDATDPNNDSIIYTLEITTNGALSKPLKEAVTGNYDASASTSSPDAIVGDEWHWECDGSMFRASADTGWMQIHSSPASETYTVAVRVTDDDGSTAIATFVVIVYAVAAAGGGGSSIDSTLLLFVWLLLIGSLVNSWRKRYRLNI